MHGAHGIEVLSAGRALEDGCAFAHLDNQEIQCLGDGCIGQLPTQHSLHLLQSVEVGNLLTAGHARAGACIQRGQDVALLRQPMFKVVVLGHGLSGLWVGFACIRCICNYCRYN